MGVDPALTSLVFIGLLAVVVLGLIAFRNRRRILSRYGAHFEEPKDSTGTAPRKPSITGREVVIWGMPVLIFNTVGLIIFLLLIQGCLTPMILRREPSLGSQPSSSSIPVITPVTTPVVTTPVNPPTPPVDYQQEWVRLMGEKIEAKAIELANVLASNGLASQFWLEDLPPVSTVALQPGEAHFTGQVLAGEDPGFVWLNFNGPSVLCKDIEVGGFINQTKWIESTNPMRIFSEPGMDAVLVRIKPGSPVLPGLVTVTTERVIKKGQRHPTDVATLPAVRKVYRHVSGKQRILVTDEIITSFPSLNRRVECTVMVLLVGSDGKALDPASSASSFVVDDGSGGLKPHRLKYEATTVGKTSFELLVSPNEPGLYDIIVVLTPL